MGKVVKIYADGKEHKEGSFPTQKERDKEVRQLRKDGWTVKVGHYPIIDIYWYEAKK